MIQSASSVPRYGRPKLVSNFQLSTPDEYATCLVQSNTETSSQLILGTTLSRLTILDLRTMQVLQTLRNPVEYGPITCLCVDRKKTWLLVGTLSGVVCLWDLRFGLRLRAWHVGPSEAGMIHRVNRIAIHPSKGRGRWVLVAFEKVGDPGGPDGQEVNPEQPEVIVETWDIDRGIRVETFETRQGAAAGASQTSRSTKLRPVLDGIDARTNAGQGSSLVDSTNSDRTVVAGAKSRHDSMLTGAAAAIEKLLQQQQKQVHHSALTPSSDANAVDVDPFATAPQNTASQAPAPGAYFASALHSCAVKALSVSLEGYTSSSLSAAATTKPHDVSTQEGAVEGGDGTETIHAETGGGWLDVGKLTRATDRMTISPPSGASNNQSYAVNGGGSGPGGYMITAGSDARLRFWDLGKPEKSLIFGVPPRVIPSSHLSSTARMTGSSGGALVSIDAKSDFRCLAASAPSTPNRIVHSLWYGDQNDTSEDSTAAAAARGGGVSGTRLKSPLLANQTAVYAHMSRAHKDAVTDVLVIEAPFRCIVAADRGGCIRVWE